MECTELLYEGKAKRVHKTSEPSFYVIEFKDDATAFDGEKKGTVADKGMVNNQVSARFFQLLSEHGVDNHFRRLLSRRLMLVQAVEIIRVEVVVRNIAAGGLCRRLGLPEGLKLTQPVLELYYKSDALKDPLINSSHVELLQLATPKEIAAMRDTSLQVNRILRSYLNQRGIDLIDYKLEFGRTSTGILLADEISPDTCRFWDVGTGKKLDKDRFRFDLGDVESGYHELLERVMK